MPNMLMENVTAAKIAIIDADLVGRKLHHFPNLACMKLSGYWKDQGAEVVLKCDYTNLSQFNKVFRYKHSLFAIPAKFRRKINLANEVMMYINALDLSGARTTVFSTNSRKSAGDSSMGWVYFFTIISQSGPNLPAGKSAVDLSAGEYGGTYPPPPEWFSPACPDAWRQNWPPVSRVS